MNSGINGTWRAMKDKLDFWKRFLPVIGWKLFYNDDTTFSSEDGVCCAAPSAGVVCYMVYHPDGRRTGIWNHDEYNPKGCVCVKLGGMVGELGCAEYGAAQYRVMIDKWRPQE